MFVTEQDYLLVRILNCWIIPEHSDPEVREVNWDQKIFSVDKGKSS